MESLYVSPDERTHLEYLSDLYAVIVAIERVDLANKRDLITQDQYTSTIRRLLEKYHSVLTDLTNSHNLYFTNIDDFLQKYCLSFPAALVVLKEGPRTTAAGHVERLRTRFSVECTQLTIAIMDALKLRQASIDMLNPPLFDLLENYTRLGLAQRDFVIRLSSWKKRFDNMNAADMLDENASRDFSYDIERAHQRMLQWIDSDPEFAVAKVAP